jgi:hypothetical protein
MINLQTTRLRGAMRRYEYATSAAPVLTASKKGRPGATLLDQAEINRSWSSSWSRYCLLNLYA